MKPATLETERRKWSRLPLPIPIFLRGTDQTGAPFLELASVLNISAGGALIATPRALSASTSILLEIPSAPPISVASSTAAVRTITAQTVRVERVDDYYLTGFKFSAPLPMDSRSVTPKPRKSRSSK